MPKVGEFKTGTRLILPLDNKLIWIPTVPSQSVGVATLHGDGQSTVGRNIGLDLTPHVSIKTRTG